VICGLWFVKTSHKSRVTSHNIHMLIRMLETRRGTEDGFTVKQYMAGEKYEVREHLALAFFAAGCATIVKVRKSISKIKTGDCIFYTS